MPCLQVVYLTEPIDEVTIQNMAKYGEHAFVDVSKEEIDLGEDEDEKAKASSARKNLRRALAFVVCAAVHNSFRGQSTKRELEKAPSAASLQCVRGSRRTQALYPATPAEGNHCKPRPYRSRNAPSLREAFQT